VLVIFFKQGGFLASEKGKSHKGQDLANKEGDEARQPFMLQVFSYSGRFL
jgi:hypothetical protein